MPHCIYMSDPCHKFYRYLLHAHRKSSRYLMQSQQIPQIRQVPTAIAVKGGLSQSFIYYNENLDNKSDDTTEYSVFAIYKSKVKERLEIFPKFIQQFITNTTCFSSYAFKIFFFFVNKFTILEKKVLNSTYSII